jgi:putative PIN family toxin of toxin-antitoxin system
MKIVLDTNSLIQSVPRQSRYHIVWQALVKGEHVLCVSNEILEEYLEILQRLTDYETAELIVKTIVNSPFVELITPYYHFQMIQADPDDNKFVDCAIAAGARYVVTNDHHFDVLRQTPFPHVDIIALAEFAKLLKRM